MSEMSEKYKKNRWYDNEPKAVRVFELIENLQQPERAEFANNLYHVLNIVKKQKFSKELNLSLGENKIHGYYQSFNKRRWYDQMPELMRAINLLNTLSFEERQDILDGILIALENNK
jgi:hypothetical protein